MEFQLSEVTELCRKVHSKEAARDAGNLATSHMHFTLVTDCAQVADMEMQLSEVTEMRRKVHSAEAARDAASEESSKATSMLKTSLSSSSASVLVTLMALSTFSSSTTISAMFLACVMPNVWLMCDYAALDTL